jgi:hypothetical protein
MDESPAVALQSLHDEPFAAEETRADLLVQCNTTLTPLAAHRKESFWAISSPPI